MVLFISGGEIFIILLIVLLFFGSEKIPELARLMGKGVREFRKATDDIKRELNNNTSGVMNDFRAIKDDLSESLTKEISEPIQDTTNETAKTFDDFNDRYNNEYYYNNQEYAGNYENEYQKEMQTTNTVDTADTNSTTDTVSTSQT